MEYAVCIYPMKVLHHQEVMNTRSPWLGSKGVSTSVALCQCVQQCLRLLQVSGVKALGEPAIDRRQQRMGRGVYAPWDHTAAALPARSRWRPRPRLLAGLKRLQGRAGVAPLEWSTP